MSAFLLLAQASAAIISEWNFNSAVADADATTGTLSSSRGDGTIGFTGGATSEFGSVGAGANSDPAEADNSQIRLRSLPRIDQANKSVGFEVTLATTGFENLSLSWDQYNSRTASRYWRVQYTRDGLNWNDHLVVTNTSASRWVHYTVPLSDILAVQNRSYVGLRVVQEFENTATGEGVFSYVAVDPTANYSTAGSWWIDMVRVSGRMIGTTNSKPVLSDISSVEMLKESDSDEIEFTVSDAESSPSGLRVEATIPDTNVVRSVTFKGDGATRTIKVGSGQVGVAQVTVRVTDEEDEFTERTFQVRVVEDVSETPKLFFTLWNFNSAVDDNDVATGTMGASLGTGELKVIGTDSFNFGSVGQGRSSDPAETDNSMLRVRSFPAQGTGDRTCGIELMVSTVGRGNISLYWDQYNSATASRYWRIQYSTNGADFIDHARWTNSVASAWQRARKVDFAEIPAVENNAHFGVRIVAEFADDAGYAAVSETSSYSASGTLWLDMIGLTGDEIDPGEIPEPAAPPMLEVELATEVRLSWPSSASGFILESTDDLQTGWQAVEIPAAGENGRLRIVLAADGAARFFRLRK